MDGSERGRYSRSKGARAERELVTLLSDYLGLTLNRQLKQYQQAQHGDIEQLVGPYLIECKNVAKQTPAMQRAWWMQAVAAAAVSGAVPCVARRLPGLCMEDRWLFRVPEWWAWQTEFDWRAEFRYTKELGIEAFAGNVRGER